MSQPLAGLSILLVDDHALVRMGLRALLESVGARVLAEADNGEEALRLYDEMQPDVLILDLYMPGMGGFATLERLRARHPAARVLILSAHHEVVMPVRALRIGALGYLCKRSAPQEFIKAVRQIGRNQRYLDPLLAQQVALVQLGGAADPSEALTDKEFAIFLQLAQGHSVNEVAQELHLSPSTVGTHLYHIKQKLNVQNAAELALIAVRCGLIDV